MKYISNPENLDDLCNCFSLNYLKVGLSCTPSVQSKIVLDKLNDGIITIKGFDDLSISLQDFDWVNGVNNRSWWWQVQALPYLNNFIDASTKIPSIDKEKYFNLTKSLIFSWIIKSSKNNKSPLAWHDHASAYRLRNIVRWLAYIYNQKLIDLLTIEEKESLLEIILEHIRWLGEDENYSKHTNHGFDQMLILYRTCLIFSAPAFLHKIQCLSKDRLLDELSFSFTDQGVHKENSPGYQQFMLARIKELVKLNELGDTDISSKAQLLIDKAEEFLYAITLPNNLIPIIGDTQSIKSALVTSANKNRYAHIEVYDYSLSGYIIIRGVNVYNDDFHFVLKSSHLSSYHRHDDDLSIHWYVNNEVIVGDSGLLSHEEKEFKRMYMRSHFAHSVPFIKNIIPERTPSLLKSAPNCVLEKEHSLIKATSTAFAGVTIERVIDYSQILFNIITVEDSILSNTQDDLCVNFLFPEENTISRTKNNRINVTSTKNSTILECDDEVTISSFFGLSEQISSTAITSNIFNHYHNCSRVTIHPKNNIKNKLQIQSVPSKHNLSLKHDAFFGDIKRLITKTQNNSLLVINNNDNCCYITPYNDDFSFEKTNRNHIKIMCDTIRFNFDATSNNLASELIVIFYGGDNKKVGIHKISESQEELITPPILAHSFKLYIKIQNRTECTINKISWSMETR